MSKYLRQSTCKAKFVLSKSFGHFRAWFLDPVAVGGQLVHSFMAGAEPEKSFTIVRGKQRGKGGSRLLISL